MTWFRKRISAEMLSEINDYIIGRKVIGETEKKDRPTNRQRKAVAKRKMKTKGH